mgnify:CR=1 FL=1
MGYAQRRNEVDGTTTDPDTGALITSFDLDTSTSGFMDNWTWKSVAAQFGVHNGIGSSYKQPTGTPHPRYGMHDDGGTGDGISAGRGAVQGGASGTTVVAPSTSGSTFFLLFPPPMCQDETRANNGDARFSTRNNMTAWWTRTLIFVDANIAIANGG